MFDETILQILGFIAVWVCLFIVCWKRVSEIRKEKKEKDDCEKIFQGQSERPSELIPINKIVQGIDLEHEDSNKLIEQLEKVGYFIIEKKTGISPSQLNLMESVRRYTFGLLGMKDWNKVEKTIYKVFPHEYKKIVLALAQALSDLKRDVLLLEDTSMGSRITVKIPKKTMNWFFQVDEGVMVFDLEAKSTSHTMITARFQAVTVNYMKRFTNFDGGQGRKDLYEVLDKLKVL